MFANAPQLFFWKKVRILYVVYLHKLFFENLQKIMKVEKVKGQQMFNIDSKYSSDS